jgi:hypothetical protein
MTDRHEWHFFTQGPAHAGAPVHSLTSFNPITEATSVPKKKSRQKSVGSRKKRIPTAAVPAAPIPVQTA